MRARACTALVPSGPLLPRRENNINAILTSPASVRIYYHGLAHPQQFVNHGHRARGRGEVGAVPVQDAGEGGAEVQE